MSNGGVGGRNRAVPAQSGMGDVLPVQHYLLLLKHRKWRVISVWLLVSVAVATGALFLPDVYMSDTVILVDPQKVPEAYVKSTVTGDVRNRLSTLSQQILSATRLQKIIDTHKLYPEERKRGMAREDLITKMRADISVKVVSEFVAVQDLQAFRITYSGPEPRLVAQVTNQLAELFIEENLKAREQQATGTTDFLGNQLQETRRALELQEAKLRDFKLKHVGEMPQQQEATLQLLSQTQSQLQMEADALSRAEQQRSYLQSMMAQSAPVIDVDEGDQKGPSGTVSQARPPKPSAVSTAKLASLLARYGPQHPDVQRLKRQIEEEEALEAKEAATSAVSAPVDPAPAAAPAVKRAPRVPVHSNPVLESQLSALDEEIKKHKREVQRMSSVASSYRTRLDAIPVREQEITALVRDYEISKAHYKQLLENQLSAQTATQLEIRQKGEKFEVLDRAQPAERPSKPNRPLLDLAGSLGGLVLGLLLAIGGEFIGASIISPEDVTIAGGSAVLGIIPVIQTEVDRRLRYRRLLVGATSFVIVALAVGAVLFYHYRIQI